MPPKIRHMLHRVFLPIVYRVTKQLHGYHLHLIMKPIFQLKQENMQDYLVQNVTITQQITKYLFVQIAMSTIKPTWIKNTEVKMAMCGIVQIVIHAIQMAKTDSRNFIPL